MEEVLEVWVQFSLKTKYLIQQRTPFCSTLIYVEMVNGLVVRYNVRGVMNGCGGL